MSRMNTAIPMATRGMTSGERKNAFRIPRARTLPRVSARAASIPATIARRVEAEAMISEFTMPSRNGAYPSTNWYH